MPTTLKIRLSEEELGRWRKKAADGGVTLSEWVRKQCNDVADGIAIELRMSGPREMAVVEKISEAEVGNGQAKEPGGAVGGDVLHAGRGQEPEGSGRGEEDGEVAAAVAQRVGGRAYAARGKHGAKKEEKKGKCEAPVGPGIYCPTCQKRH